jgi:hypothetical protein
MSFCEICNNLNRVTDRNTCTNCGFVSEIDPENNIVYTFVEKSSHINVGIIDGITTDPCAYKIHNKCEVCDKHICVIILGSELDVIFKCECEDEPKFDKSKIKVSEFE